MKKYLLIMVTPALLASVFLQKNAKVIETGSIQSEITLYRNAQYPLEGTADGAQFNWPGIALSGNVSVFYANIIRTGHIKYARWVVVWNPNTGDSPTGIRLVKADFGPSNIEQIARIDGRNYTSPRVDAVEVTQALQAILDDGTVKQLGHQTYGNGQWGNKIYGSWIEVVWE